MKINAMVMIVTINILHVLLLFYFLFLHFLFLISSFLISHFLISHSLFYNNPAWWGVVIKQKWGNEEMRKWRNENETQAVTQSKSEDEANIYHRLKSNSSIYASTEIQVPPGTLPPYRHTNLCSSISWYTVWHSLPRSTCVPCTTGMVQTSDLRTYVTVLTCTVLQSHSPKQFTNAWLYWQYIHRFHNPVGKW